jgi:hypothetical protein
MHLKDFVFAIAVARSFSREKAVQQSRPMKKLMERGTTEQINLASLNEVLAARRRVM